MYGTKNRILDVIQSHGPNLEAIILFVSVQGCTGSALNQFVEANVFASHISGLRWLGEHLRHLRDQVVSKSLIIRRKSKQSVSNLSIGGGVAARRGIWRFGMFKCN